jgi:secondary thiamine-phosphate synthase enzyme
MHCPQGGDVDMIQRGIEVASCGRGTLDITSKVESVVVESGITTGLAHLFLRHTSASLILCENADPAVRRDLETFMSRCVPDGDPEFEHSAEGPDDMPAHVRTILTHSSFSVPIVAGRLGLGTWQGIYLWEHRKAPHNRRILVTIQGE